MSLPQHIALVEAGLPQAFDGVEAPVMAAVAGKLAGSGISTIETARFCTAGDTAPVDGDTFLNKTARPQSVAFLASVDGVAGARAALASGADRLSVSVAASQTYAQRAGVASIEETLSRLEAVMAFAGPQGIAVRGHIPCAMGCPYEGGIAPERVAALAARLWATGVYEICLEDTLGAAVSGAVKNMVRAVSGQVPIEKLAIRCCDRNAQGISGIHAAIQAGVRVIDGSTGGFAHPEEGPAGYVAMEDILVMLKELGLADGVDTGAVIEAAWLLAGALGHQPHSEAAFHPR